MALNLRTTSAQHERERERERERGSTLKKDFSQDELEIARRLIKLSQSFSRVIVRSDRRDASGRKIKIAFPIEEADGLFEIELPDVNRHRHREPSGGRERIAEERPPDEAREQANQSSLRLIDCRFLSFGPRKNERMNNAAGQSAGRFKSRRVRGRRNKRAGMK